MKLGAPSADVASFVSETSAQRAETTMISVNRAGFCERHKIHPSGYRNKYFIFHLHAASRVLAPPSSRTTQRPQDSPRQRRWPQRTSTGASLATSRHCTAVRRRTRARHVGGRPLCDLAPGCGVAAGATDAAHVLFFYYLDDKNLITEEYPGYEIWSLVQATTLEFMLLKLTYLTWRPMLAGRQVFLMLQFVPGVGYPRLREWDSFVAVGDGDADAAC